MLQTLHAERTSTKKQTTRPKCKLNPEAQKEWQAPHLPKVGEPYYATNTLAKPTPEKQWEPTEPTRQTQVAKNKQAPNRQNSGKRKNLQGAARLQASKEQQPPSIKALGNLQALKQCHEDPNSCKILQ